MKRAKQAVADLVQVRQACSLLRERANFRAQAKARSLADARSAVATASTRCDEAMEGWQGAVQRARFDPAITIAWASDLEAARARRQSAEEHADNTRLEYDAAMVEWRQAFARTEVAGQLCKAAQSDLFRMDDERALAATADALSWRGLER
jgi:hypothetical protein